MNVFGISELCSPLIYLILEVCMMCHFHHLSCSVCFLNISFNKKIKRYCRQEVIYEASTYNLTHTKNNNCIIWLCYLNILFYVHHSKRTAKHDKVWCISHNKKSIRKYFYFCLVLKRYFIRIIDLWFTVLNIFKNLKLIILLK